MCKYLSLYLSVSGTETNDAYVTNNGNDAPYTGFAHLAVATRNVAAAAATLAANGVTIMADGVTCRDPDGYYVRLVERAADSPVTLPFTLAEACQVIYNINIPPRIHSLPVPCFVS